MRQEDPAGGKLKKGGEHPAPQEPEAPEPKAAGAAGAAGRAASRSREPVGPDWEIKFFHVTAENACPYLPARLERKLVARLGNDRGLFNRLSAAGFRRTHGYLYRPACSACQACVPVRLRVTDFQATKSQIRVVRRNADLTSASKPARASTEQYGLFARYLQERHAGGEMADMTLDDYRSMVEDTPVDTRLIEYRGENGRLLAVALVDCLHEGLSAVYSFFAPEYPQRSLGAYMILDLVEKVRAAGQSYLYLGYWIGQSPKMAYKARFRPIEGYGSDGWQRF
jgi:arginine-tRNA-protein transferase